MDSAQARPRRSGTDFGRLGEIHSIRLQAAGLVPAMTEWGFDAPGKVCHHA